MTNPVFSIGHSNHDIEVFLGLLAKHHIDAIGDVRSHPYSRHFPQYSREPLRSALGQAGVAYVFLGRELGARSSNPDCYRNGRVQYELLAKESSFQEGLERIFQGSKRYRVALLCAEKDPIQCHRALLVCRHLTAAGRGVEHIHADGTLETQRDMERRLLSECKLPPNGDMFRGRDEFIADAYRIQGERVAYQDDEMERSLGRSVGES